MNSYENRGVENPDPSVSRQPPRNIHENIITRRLIIQILTSSFTIVLLTFCIYYSHLDSDGLGSSKGRSMTFTAFVVSDLWNSLACRSDKRFLIQLSSNKFYIWAVLFCLSGQIMVIHVGFLQQIFQTSALQVWEWMFIFAVGSLVWIVAESVKYLESRQVKHTFSYDRIL